MDVLTKLQKRTGETDTDLLEVLLDDAKNAILARRFQFGDYPTREVTETVTRVVTTTDEETNEETSEEVEETVTTEETYVEDRYLDLQYRIALDLYNKMGAEGQLSHSENGVSRAYESSWISAQLLEEVTPFVGTVS